VRWIRGSPRCLRRSSLDLLALVGGRFALFGFRRLSSEDPAAPLLRTNPADENPRAMRASGSRWHS